MSILTNTPKVIWSATPTPFLADGALDMAALERVVDQHLRLGVTGLFLAGSCGGGPFMPNDQRVELVRSVARLAGSRLRIAAQVSDTSAARVRENIGRMEQAGAHTVVVAPPWIARFCNRDFARRYFHESIEAATVPVGIYVQQQPPETGLDLALWLELANHPRIVLVKDSSGSAEYCQAFAKVRQQRPDLLLLTGNEFDVRSAVAAGYDGALLGTGILNGQLIRRALSADGAAWQQRSNEFLWDLFGRDIRLWLGGLKYALTRLGIFSTEFMHLSYPLTAADRARIDAALEREREFISPSPREGHAQV